MKAVINIIGEISPEQASLIGVISQYKAYEAATEIELRVNSVGGYVSEGDAIYNYVKSLGLPVTTIAVEKCMSIATKVFLAGDVRKVEAGCQFMIHNPFLDGITGDADALQAASEHVRVIENDFMKFYAKVLNLPIEAIKPLAKRETFLNEKQLIDLGFASEIIPGNYEPKQYKAVAKLNFNNNDMNNNKEVLSLLQRIEKSIMNFGKKYEAKNELTLIDEVSGTEVTFPNLEPDQVPSVGDTVSVTEGSFSFNGMKVEVAAGVVTEVEVLEAESMDEEKELMAKELEELKSKLAQYEDEVAKKDEEMAKLKAVAKLKVDLEKQLNEVKAMFSGEDDEALKRNHKEPKHEAKAAFKEVLTKMKNRK